MQQGNGCHKMPSWFHRLSQNRMGPGCSWAARPTRLQRTRRWMACLPFACPGPRLPAGGICIRGVCVQLQSNASWRHLLGPCLLQACFDNAQETRTAREILASAESCPTGNLARRREIAGPPPRVCARLDRGIVSPRFGNPPPRRRSGNDRSRSPPRIRLPEGRPRCRAVDENRVRPVRSVCSAEPSRMQAPVWALPAME